MLRSGEEPAWRGQGVSPDVPTPQQVHEVVLLFLRELFSHAAEYRYSDDVNQTKIVISPSYPLDAVVLGGRPGLSVATGSWAWRTLGLNDVARENLQSGQREFSSLVDTMVRIHVVCGNDIEALNLAFQICEMFWVLRNVLLKNGVIFDVARQAAVTDRTAPEQVVVNDGGRELYVSTVSFNLSVSRNVVVTPLGHELLQRVQTKVASVFGSQAPAKVPGTPSAEVSAPPFAPALDVRGGAMTPYSGEPPRLPIDPPTQAGRTSVARPLPGGLVVKRTSL